jgi:hypothetical protein
MFHQGLLVIAAGKAHGGFSFSMSPNLSAPGAAGLQSLINTILFYALAACGIGALGGIAAWAGAKAFHMDHVSSKGKEGFLVALACAFVLGGVGAFLNAAYTMG